MANQNWISLFEYSVKYGLSLSTLRRRIKTHSILFKLDGGKYFLLDETPKVVAEPPKVEVQIPTSIQAVEKKPASEVSVLASANKLVEELKAAYAKILQEKEEQIGILREEIVDLKMLVNLLENQVNTSKVELEKTSRAEQVISPAPDLSTATFFFPEIES